MPAVILTMKPSAHEIRRRYIDFFVNRYGHKEIPSSSVIPENDPTVLFTTAGMHPLVPYLMGEPHPAGKRLVDAQKSLRTDDIDEVGDSTHCTFFEMLGNWSLGDYFKDLAIQMSYELLTLSWKDGGFGLAHEGLSVSCFAGDSDAPKDTVSAEIWNRKGIPLERIYFYPKAKNWWGPAGQTGPCGPDTEMFYDTVGVPDKRAHKREGVPDKYPPIDHPGFKAGDCHPNCECGRYVEIWNDVFMEYNKKGPGKFEPLAQKNVDTGMGFERMVAILHGKESPFETELFWPVVSRLLLEAGVDHGEGEIPAGAQGVSVRIIADHLRAATFILGDPLGVAPSNVDQGYIVRRLIRRAIRHAKLIGLEKDFTSILGMRFIELYGDIYPELQKNRQRIIDELTREEQRFKKTLERGLKELQKMMQNREGVGALGGRDAFYIFETYGFPLEMIEEELAKEGLSVNREEFQKAFDEAFKKHQALSRVGAEQKFAGGLADHSQQCMMHHTATHLVHQALRDVLGPHVFQRGSNITKERLRFDFSHGQKMTPDEVRRVEEIVNTQIQKDVPVHFEILDVDEAKRRGAIGIFDDKYAQLGNKVKVYFMGDYSKEVCGGPHVENTGVLKHFKILKEEACSSGVRRIKALVEGIKEVA